jgi:hypothetical protein
MKSTLLLIVAFIFSTLRVSSINLKDAIASNLVAVDVSGSNYDSIPVALRYSGAAPKMQMTVSNLSSESIALELEPGYMLEATQPGYQAMLLVQPVDVQLRPNERRLQYLYAMCTEVSKSCPYYSLSYKVADKAKPALLEMARYVASKNYVGAGAQEAVWSISDNFPLMSIHEKDTGIERELQKKAAAIKGVHLDELLKEYAKRDSLMRIGRKIEDRMLAEFNGDKSDRNLIFSIRDTAMVSVGFYDYGGKFLKSINDAKLFKEGRHCIRYNPYPLALAGKRYLVKMIKNGVVEREYYFIQ